MIRELAYLDMGGDRQCQSGSLSSLQQETARGERGQPVLEGTCTEKLLTFFPLNGHFEAVKLKIALFWFTFSYLSPRPVPPSKVGNDFSCCYLHLVQFLLKTF